ncbi:MAG: aldo/keto reductase [Phycisphaerae bacterium]|nr:aldo/keto reductase [Phycisphaerae bacterium]
MKTHREQLGRRDFLKKATQAAATVAVSAGIAAAAAPQENKSEQAETIPARSLGKTGLKLPLLGYGGAALPATWLNPLTTQQRVELVRYAWDQGVRYFDTSPVYMESETILGEALKDRRRDVCLVTKVESTKPEQVRKSVEKSLKTLQTDYLDILLIHGTPGLEQMSVPQAMKVHAELIKLRDERVTRFVGFSAHGYFDKALALIASGGFDVCMLSYGYIPRGHDQIWTARLTTLRDACLAKAHELGMGIVAMKVLGAGMLGAWSGYVVPGFDKRRLEQLSAAAIHHVLDDQRVHILNIGMRLKEDVDANIKILRGDTTYTPEDRDLLAEFSSRLFDTDAIKKLRIEGAYTADIWTAAREGKLDAMRQYLAAGTSVNAREPQGGATPLNTAALFGQAKVAAFLIEKGADVSIANNDGNTALHLASFFAHLDVVELLLKHGAPVRVQNGRGETPLDLVASDWSRELEEAYTSIADMIGMQIDLPRIREARPKVARLLRERAEGM